MEQNIIKDCEQEYIRCFSKTTEHEEFAQYSDALLPDMYKHNFIAVHKSVAPGRIKIPVQ